MTYRRCLIALLALFATSAHGAGLDISLSDRTAHFQYLVDSGSLGYGGADAGFGIFFTEQDDYLGTANLLVTSNPASRTNVQFGVGAKAYGGEVNVLEETVAAVGIGGLVRYVIPSQTPMGVAVEAYHAPRITSFSDTDKLTEVMTRFEIEVMPSTRGYVGYRLLEPDLTDFGDVELDDEFHVGIRITY